MNKKLKKFLIGAGITVAGINVVNRLFLTLSNIDSHLPLGHAKYYKSRFGNIYYTEIGEGSPILMIHDLLAEANGSEWDEVAKCLQNNHKVYLIDLPGCGRSDKPDILYTQYVYDLLVQNFIRDIIGEKTDVVTFGRSVAVGIMAKRIGDSKVGKIIAINPSTVSLFEKTTTPHFEGMKYFLDSPVLGTFIYNMVHSHPLIKFRLGRNITKAHPEIATNVTKSRFHSAHFDFQQGKALFASCVTRYMNLDIKRGLMQLEEPLFIIQGENVNRKIITQHQYNRYVETLYTYEIKGTSDIPQVERPEITAAAIKKAIAK